MAGSRGCIQCEPQGPGALGGSALDKAPQDLEGGTACLGLWGRHEE